MLRCLIVDDERLARLALRRLLEERGDVEIVGEADSVASARKLLAALDPDVVFLDVQMPGSSGFELLKEQVRAKVIFCTAYEQYAVRAFEVNALDYLIKPVGPEHVERALRRALGPAEAQPVANEALGAEDLVALREAHGLRFTPVRDITFVQAADDYSEVRLVSGVVVLVDVTLRRWEARLPAQDFARIHRSFLVNLRHVEAVQHVAGRWQVSLRGGPILTVSRRMASELKDRLRSAVP